MKILHAADLHLGKRFHELSLKEEQEHMLGILLGFVRDQKPDALLLCGDIYDKARPSAESVEMLNAFLTELADLPLHVFMIAGNHDSPARLSYGASFMARQRVHIKGDLRSLPEVITLEDAWGPVHFVLLPYFHLYEARLLFPEEADTIENYDDALERIFEALDLPEGERSVLLSHQHYAADGIAETSDSELNIIGGLEACSSRLLERFSYAALGHLHRPQALSAPYIRYAGSPLAYSFSEADQQKSFPLIELRAPGEAAAVEFLPIKAKHPVLRKEGYLKDLIEEADSLSRREREAFLEITLLDEERLSHPLRRLQVKYPNVLNMIPKRNAEAEGAPMKASERPENKDLLSLFKDFYREQSGREPDSQEEALLQETLDELRAEDAERRKA